MHITPAHSTGWFIFRPRAQTTCDKFSRYHVCAPAKLHENADEVTFDEPILGELLCLMMTICFST